MERNSDLVLMLHLRPTGKEETVQVSVGLYFTDTPPTRVPALLRLTRQDLEIPAGATRYEVTSTFRTAGRSRPVHRAASRPQPGEGDGGLRDAPRRHAEAAALRQGLGLQLAGRLSLRRSRSSCRPGRPSRPAGVYDNSEANPRNPNRPPQPVLVRAAHVRRDGRAVVSGRAADVRPIGTADASDASAPALPENIKGYEMMLRAEPDNASLHDDVALLYAQAGNLERVACAFRRDRPHPTELRDRALQPGQCPTAAGPAGRGAARVRARHRDRPGATPTRIAVWASALYRDGQLRGCGSLLRAGDPARARRRVSPPQLRRAPPGAGASSPRRSPITEMPLRFDSRHPDAHHGLALAFRSQGKAAESVRHYREALQSVPNWPDVLIDLAWLLATAADPSVRNPQEAVQVAERAVRSAPLSWQALDASAVALASAQRFEEATERARRALDLAIAAGNNEAAGQIRERLRFCEGRIR